MHQRANTRVTPVPSKSIDRKRTDPRSLAPGFPAPARHLVSGPALRAQSLGYLVARSSSPRLVEHADLAASLNRTNPHTYRFRRNMPRTNELSGSDIIQ